MKIGRRTSTKISRIVNNEKAKPLQPCSSSYEDDSSPSILLRFFPVNVVFFWVMFNVITDIELEVKMLVGLESRSKFFEMVFIMSILIPIDYLNDSISRIMCV